MIYAFSAALAFCFFSGVDCKNGPPDGPPPGSDSLITFERELANGQQPAMSPDGKKIAYANNGDIFVMDTSVEVIKRWVPPNWLYDTVGGNITQLTRGSEIDILPRWAPDGQTIGFVRLQTELDDDGIICTVASTGGGTTQIQLQHSFSNKLKRRNEAYGGISVPMWDFSPDGKYLAFISQDNDSDYLNVIDNTLGQDRFHKALFKYLDDDTPCFAWSLNSGDIAFISGERDSLGGRASRAQLYNIISNSAVNDSLGYGGLYINRSPISNTFLFRANEGGKYVVRFTNFKDKIEKLPIPFIAAIKLSPDENLLLHQVTAQVFGPGGYEYSQIGIFDIRNSKEYLLVKNGDIHGRNFYFEWGKSSNIVFFERFGKIVKSTFRLP